jgi:hypothetical protein
MNEDINERAAQVDALGTQRHGANWSKFVSALGQRGVSPDELANAIRQANAVDLIVNAGREALIAQADDSHEANTTYAEIRDEERKKYRRSRGR